MQARPTFRLMDGHFLGDPDNALSRDAVSLGASLKLEESSVAGTPLSLGSSDGSLGQLGLPLGMALAAEGALCLLLAEESRIKIFDRASRSFVYLPAIGGEGKDARQFQSASNIALSQGNLYIADRGKRRVQVFAKESLALRYIWDDLDAADVCSANGLAYVLDQERGRVFRHTPGRDELQVVVDSASDAGRWSRVLEDRSGQIYLFDRSKSELSIFNADGVSVGTTASAGDVRDRFQPPPLVLNHLDQFAWQGSTYDMLGRGVEADPYAPLGPKPYQTEGTWISRAQDSGIYRCTWHRIELEIDLPGGTRVVVSTYSDNRLRSDEDIAALDREWDTDFTLVSSPQTRGSTLRSSEFLIQRGEGQYLWLRVSLHGDGFATPAVRLLRIHYPRETYLEYLPAIYSSDGEGRLFLENLLAVFKTEWDSLESRAAEIARYFDPKAVPDSLVDWLATWLALPLEQSWMPVEKRNLLAAAPKLIPRFGTAEGVRAFMRVYFENLSGHPLPDGYPVIVEGFMRRRQFVSLAGRSLGRAGDGVPMWSASAVGRLQLGEFSRVGEARIISIGSPDTDIFRSYAHRFQLYAPAVAVQTAEDERMLRRAVESAKPAHTVCDLVLVAPRFRVGMQSSIGLDTVIGGYPEARLASQSEAANRAPSVPALNGLGYDTVLASVKVDAGFRLSRRGVRAGVATILN